MSGQEVTLNNKLTKLTPACFMKTLGRGMAGSGMLLTTVMKELWRHAVKETEHH